MKDYAKLRYPNFMDIHELKKLIKNSTSVLVLDDGEPSFVILGYDAYKNLASDHGGEKEIIIHPAAKDGKPLATLRSHLKLDDVHHQNGQAFGSFVGGDDPHEREIQILERLNKEISALKSQIDIEEGRLGGTHNQTID